MKKIYILFIAVVALFTYSCKHNAEENAVAVYFNTPDGLAYSVGDTIKTHISYSKDVKVDSIIYQLDSSKALLKKDSTDVLIPTAGLPMGAKTIKATLYHDAQSQSVATTIVIKPAWSPARLDYKVIKKFPHDTSAFTEGLAFDDGYLYESTGKMGRSEIRKIDIETGKVIASQKLQDKYYGKGMAIVGDKAVMFTYKDRIGFVFDKKTLKPLGQFNMTVGVEGWGATFDGKYIYMDDSSNRVWFLDKDNYSKKGFIDVWDNNGPVQINELEYIDGKLFANIYQYDTILVIDPKTGAVMFSINLSQIWPGSERAKDFDGDNNILNGIAYDAKDHRIFITGKKWPYIYQVVFAKKEKI